MADVTVAIPTFRRPQGLARLLAALAKLRTDASVTVLVADNDAEGREGLAVCRAAARLLSLALAIRTGAATRHLPGAQRSGGNGACAACHAVSRHARRR